MGAFLIMLVAGIAAVVIVACLFMCGKWLKDYITKRLQQPFWRYNYAKNNSCLCW